MQAGLLKNQQRINKKLYSLENNGWNTEHLQEIRPLTKSYETQ